MSRKLALARLAQSLKLDELGFSLQKIRSPAFIRAVNYHDVPPSEADAFARQLAFYAERYECVGPEELTALHEGRWESDRPGILLSFDDGLRSHAEVVAPLLERHGMVGWFMVPIAFIDAAPERQRDFAREHAIGHEGYDYGDPRIAMSWDDVRALARRHVVGCHTWNHTRLSAALSERDLQDEIPRAKARLESELACEVPVFAWVGGEESAYSEAAAREIRASGFRLGFMTNNRVIRPGDDLLQLQRTNVESRDPEPLVRLQLSGLLDLLYLGKRRRVNRLTHTA